MNHFPFGFYNHNVRDVLAALRQGEVLRVNAANTLTTAPNILEPAALAKLQGIFAPQSAYSSITYLGEHQPKTKRIIKLRTSGSDTLVDPTDFQQSGGNID